MTGTAGGHPEHGNREHSHESAAEDDGGGGLLAARCGYTEGERISGGGAAGVTEPETVNLGRPPWSNPNVNLPGMDRR